MTALNPPGFMQALNTHSALTMRRNTLLLLGEGRNDVGATAALGGIHPVWGDRLEVTGSPSLMQVTVGSGLVAIPHDEAFAGVYSACNDGDVTLALDAADPTQYRRDIIVAEVLDTTDGDGSDLWQLSVVKGTNAGSPPAPLPTEPDKSLRLAIVNVDPAITNLTDKVSDARTWLAAPGGTLQGLGSAMPTNPARGTLFTEVNTPHTLSYYDGATWHFVADDGWTVYTPAVSGWGSATFSVRTGRWKWIGEKIAAVCINLATNNPGSGGSNIMVGLPFTPARNLRQFMTVTNEFTGGSVPGMGAAVVIASSSGTWIDRIRMLDGEGHIINQQGNDVGDNQEFYIQGYLEVA